MAIRITVWIQRLFSGLVTIGRYGKLYQPTVLRDDAEHGIQIAGITIAPMTPLRRRPLAEVCTVPVLLVVLMEMQYMDFAGLTSRQLNIAVAATVFGRPFVKRLALCYQSVVGPVLSCLSCL